MKKRGKFFSVLIKLRITIIVFSFLFILSVFLILSIPYRKSALQAAEIQLQNEDRILAQSIETRIQNTKSFSNTIIIHLNESLDEKYMENGYPSIDTATQKKIYKCMINTFTMFYDANQVMVVWNNGNSYYQNRTENYSMSTNEKELLEEMKSKNVNRLGSWFTSIDSECRIKGEGLYFVKAYADIESGKTKGYIIFKINDIIDFQQDNSSYRKHYLFDDKGHLIQTSDAKIGENILNVHERDYQLRLSRQLIEKLKNTRTDYRQNINITALESGWTLVSDSDLRGLTRGLNRTILLIMLVSFIIMGVLCIILNYIVVRIVMPVKTLSKHMISFPSELPPQIKLQKSNDEIGILVSRFNVMANKNRELFDLVLEKERQQKQLELALLQSQIKPHFLYNTLDTIYCLVKMDRNREASNVTKLLSDYYRHVLSKGMDWVLLSEEVGQVEKYLEIQSVRYSNVLKYSIEFDEDVKTIKVPKLTLQPLVENAIYHGIKPMNHLGKLCLRITQQEQLVEIRVMDDGVGFSKEHFEEILMQNKNEDSSFGLRNIVDRLQLYYGEKCKVILEEKSIGTSILIQIQVTSEEV